MVSVAANPATGQRNACSNGYMTSQVRHNLCAREVIAPTPYICPSVMAYIRRIR